MAGQALPYDRRDFQKLEVLAGVVLQEVVVQRSLTHSLLMKPALHAGLLAVRQVLAALSQSHFLTSDRREHLEQWLVLLATAAADQGFAAFADPRQLESWKVAAAVE